MRAKQRSVQSSKLNTLPYIDMDCLFVWSYLVNFPQVLYFDNFSPSPIPQVALSALKKIDWKSYGLILASVNDQEGRVFLEWEHFPSYVQIQIALHWYHNKYPTTHKTEPGINLVKKGIKSALDDLKTKHKGFLLSSHSRKVISESNLLCTISVNLLKFLKVYQDCFCCCLS